MIYPLLRRLLFLLDAETAHEFTLRQMERLQEIPLVMQALEISGVEDVSCKLWGMTFRNRLGIAAGFDKDARLVRFLAALGFGFVEVGTVTARPQDGNPRPRLFRDPAARALINRLGFNSEGAVAVAARLRKLDGLPLFVNIGRNRDVPIENAVSNYEEAFRIVAPWSDGIILNVSSPNTPGLRDLQSPVQLRELLERMRTLRASTTFNRPGVHPILVKIAPDLDEPGLAALVAVCLDLADGVVATNTTLDHSGLTTRLGAGGVSGRPLFDRSTEILRRVCQLTGPQYPLVGVGGIFTAGDARRKFDAGADLIQAYTGFVYQGPAFVKQIVSAGMQGRI